MDASVHRDTQFEIREIHQGPNAFGLVTIERYVHGSAPSPIEVPQDLLNDDTPLAGLTGEAKMQAVQLAHQILEEAAAIVYQRKLDAIGVDATAALKIPAAMLHDLVKQAEDIEARKQVAELAAAQLEADTIAKRAEFEELNQNLAAIQAATAEQSAAAKRGD